MKCEHAKKETVVIESSYISGQERPYRLDAISRGNMPKRKYYYSHGDLVEAVEKANPGREVT